MTLTRCFLPVLLAMALVGCATGSKQDASDEFEPIVVEVSGFGVYGQSQQGRSNPQQRLMALRASRLDAYRNLAERVYGSVIYGHSTVSDFALKSDSFRAYVDSYVRGARTLSVNEHPGGVVETVMELKLEPRFRQCASEVADDQVRDVCAIPMPSHHVSKSDVATTDVKGEKIDSLYYLD
ncbi:LPP20 family lipoprotein [Marinobacter sp. MDS2]|uniref:LPP20 family lipoprotein n=1 Tax=Marinobacter sp. MDS2 TaxID=3065961 RepID=UPI00273B1909|nr:LPP20 family lipoprotein [Marinobacter sp. MDS2]MDP4547285.1 LPP20 family lipoprotein [Marinobacter sp. MDS2]